MLLEYADNLANSQRVQNGDISYSISAISDWRISSVVAV